MNPLENLFILHSIDILGYLATGVVLLSFLWEGEKMRFINSIGAMLWMVWGFLVSQPPVWILNGLIILIHIVQLIRIRRMKEGDLRELEKQLSEKEDEK